MWQSWHVETGTVFGSIAVSAPPKRPSGKTTPPRANSLARHSLYVRCSGNMSAGRCVGCGAPGSFSAHDPSGRRVKVGVLTSWQGAQASARR